MNDTARLGSPYNWGIDGLVAQLRDLRVQSLETRNLLDKPPKLPSRKELHKILDGLGAVLFPNRLGRPDLNDEGIDNVAHQQAIDIAREFAAQLPKVRRLLDSDIQAAFEGDPAARSPDEVLVCYPGITAIIHHLSLIHI